MHTEQVQSAQDASARAAVERAAMARVRRASTFHRRSLKVRAAAALAAVVVSSTALGTVLAIYGTPDSAVLIAVAAEPVDDVDPLGPRSHIPRPCVAKPWLCA
jgi:hypothetical protein